MRTRHVHTGRYLILTGIVVLVVLCGDGLLLALKWPFTNKETITSLEHFSSSRVRIGNFRKTFFPRPGYIAENVSFVREAGGGTVQLASVQQLSCFATWAAVVSLTHRIDEMRFSGLHVFVPAQVPPAMHLHPSETFETTVTRLTADGAILDMAPRHIGGHLLRFVFPKLTVGNLAKKKALTLNTVVQNPEPPGNLAVIGNVGPFDASKVGDTRLAGSFDLTHADLNQFGTIGGLLTANGTFKGILRKAEVRARALIPNFEVVSSHHEVGVTVDLESVVDGVKGNVSIQSLQAHFLHTELDAHGSIGSKPGEQGKTLALDLASQHARVEDLLRLFVTADKPPLDGPIEFSTKVTLPPGNDKFLKRVRLAGRFEIDRAKFASESTQQKVDQLSERARGKGKKGDEATKEAPVVADLKSDATVRNGTAFLSHALFQVPGAVARGEGTYNLVTQTVDLHGTLAMQATLSKAAGGAKSLFLLPLDPFFKKKHAGAVIPIQITGRYPNPSFRMSLTGKK